MDLEEFEIEHSRQDKTAESLNDAASPLSVPDALKWINSEWHTACRRARWMDLLGDYAGTEPFIIDGHSLLQLVIDDPLLALGKKGDPSFQILHAFQLLEHTLDEFLKRSAVFDIVFWDSNRHVALKTGSSDFEEASRSLACKLLSNHLANIRQVSVYFFTGLLDPKWREYQFLRKPMFTLISDRSTNLDTKDPFVSHRLLCHRVFLYGLLTSGLELALLTGVEFRDSKVLSFVYGSKSYRTSDFVPGCICAAYFTATRALEKHENKSSFSLSPSRGSIEYFPESGSLTIEDVVSKVACSQAFSSLREKALLFAFLLHLIILPYISVQDRARKLEPMKAEFSHYLASMFLPNIFRTTKATIMSSNMTLDVDVRIFIALVRFLADNSSLPLQEIIGSKLAKIVSDKLSSFSVPVSVYSRFTSSFLLSPPPDPSCTEVTLGLLPFSNKIFDDELLPIFGLSDDCRTKDNTKENQDQESDGSSDSDGWDTSSQEEEMDTARFLHEVPNSGYFDDGTLFNDINHWHNHKRPLLPKHLGGEAPAKLTEWQRNRKLRSDQRFMKRLHDQAATLTGASGAALHQIKIPPVRTGSGQPSHKGQSYSRSASKSAHKQSKADIIRMKNIAQKAQKQLVESVTWLTERIRDLDSEMSLSSLEKRFLDLKRSPISSEPLVTVELALYRIHRLFKHWILDPERESAAVHDKNAVTALRTIRDISDVNYSTNDIRKSIQDILLVLGLSTYTRALVIDSSTSEDRPLSFKFVKLVEPKTKEPLYLFMRIKEHPIEWQLRVFGECMDRSMDSQADPRVSFKPDAWQRQVLDAIDDNKSLLVVAPTSAGKTFISYYAMEKVLRGSDDGVIVYVAPTKALVTQVAAEIYARFSKDLHGRSCWAIHTRDYRIHDPQNCQILVTVPEMLAIMMLSPPLAKVWTPRVKYIILDEIHTIGQQEGGSVWEQILLLAPCPIIGLSATVGEPEKFNTWLEAVQKAGGFQHTFVHHPHRYSHLRKFFYNIHEKPGTEFESISTYKSTERMRFLHPIAMLAFGPRSIPSDLALEAPDTLTLYRALKVYGNILPSTLNELNPLNFFPSDRLLQQKDVIKYDGALKECLAPMVSQFDPRDTTAPLYKVIESLEDSALTRVPPNVINVQPNRKDFKQNLIHLVCDLHAQNDLPAIFFNFDPADCEIMASTLLCVLFAKEEEWRNSNPEWNRKMAQYEEWLSRAKDRKRAAARATKNRPDPDEVPTEVVEWQATFDPKAPLPQFSFAGHSTSYTPNMLEEEVNRLARWTSTPRWALLCLRRGIAVHHAGMNKGYRSLVESLFRQGFIRVVFATGTLALGINAPTKTSVFVGDSPYLTALMYRQCAGRAGRRGFDLLGKVVFYGLPMDRVQRLTLSKLPSLGANFPVTPTLVLRLFNLLDGSGYAPAAINSVQRLFRLPQVSFGSEEGKHKLLHHLRFSIDYLRRARLLDERGRPFNLFGIASHLYYTEPNNFALVTLLRHGVFHRICAQPSVVQAKRDFILLMSHLFGRRYLPDSYLKDENTADLIKKSASMVILPPLSDDARRVLAVHEDEILRIFTGYALTYASERNAELGPDTRLPLSEIELGGTHQFSTTARFGAWLKETSLKVVARSPFVANSGHDDRFESVADLAKTARKGISLNEHAIPSFAHILSVPSRADSTEDTQPGGNGNRHAGHSSPAVQAFALNAYILDFYTHGQLQPLGVANAIRRGDVWFLLQEFHLTLMTVRGVLEQLIARKSMCENVAEGLDSSEAERAAEDLGRDFIDVHDPTEKEDDDDDVEDDKGGEKRAASGMPLSVPGVGSAAERDRKVLEVVYEATAEFEEKFKAIWA